MERPTLRQLEIFLAIVMDGTFRGAARTLGLSQVAVSDHIRQLEERLGTTLFERVPGRAPILSKAGRVVVDHGRNVLFACEALVAAARDTSDGPAPTPFATVLAAATKPARLRRRTASQRPETPPPAPASEHAKPITIAAHPALLARFQEQLIAAEDAFPDRPIAVDFSTFTAEGVVEAFTSGRIDIALFYALADTPRLVSDYLWSEPWSIFAAKAHPLGVLDSIERDDLAMTPVVLPDRTSPLRTLCETALDRAGLWPSAIALGSDDLARIEAEVADGLAIFPAFGQTAAQFATRPGIRRLSLAAPLPAVDVRRAIAPGALTDPTVAALAGLLT